MSPVTPLAASVQPPPSSDVRSTGAPLAELLHPRCIVCGRGNCRGWHLRFAPLPEGDGVAAEFDCAEEFEGYEGIVHGGVVCGLLDGAMANALFEAGLAGRTARLTVRFGQPLRTGLPARVTARIVRIRGRVRETRAEVVQNGAVAATASATFLEDRPTGSARRPGDAP